MVGWTHGRCLTQWCLFIHYKEQLLSLERPPAMHTLTWVDSPAVQCFTVGHFISDRLKVQWQKKWGSSRTGESDKEATAVAWTCSAPPHPHQSMSHPGLSFCHAYARCSYMWQTLPPYGLQSPKIRSRILKVNNTQWYLTEKKANAWKLKCKKWKI